MNTTLTESQSLRLLHLLSLAVVRQSLPELAPRQLAILLSIYLEPPPHTVRGLARNLGVTKPVITRALDTMGLLKLVDRRRDERDRRNVIIQRTVEGTLYLEKLAEIVSRSAANI